MSTSLTDVVVPCKANLSGIILILLLVTIVCLFLSLLHSIELSATIAYSLRLIDDLVHIVLAIEENQTVSSAEIMNASTEMTTDCLTCNDSVETTTDDINTALSYVYVLLTTLTSCLSILGCTLLIVVDVAFSDLRSAGRRLLTWLSIADCLTAVGNLLGVTW